MATFDDFIDNLEGGVKKLAKKHFKDSLDTAEADGEAFIENCKEDLKRWTKLLANEDLSQDDFECLVAGTKDLAEMEALKQLGLKLVRIERFQNALISLVIDTAFDMFL